jgi:hypothetical protein
MRLIPGLTLMLLLTACAPFARSTPTDSGIEGQVLIGPVCPVVIQGQECPDQPHQASLTILKFNGRVVKRFETNPQGHFRIPLAPGEYTLRPESPNGMPYAGEQNFTVLPGQFTQIIVNFDSGIR